jgi:hypothetical protein
VRLWLIDTAGRGGPSNAATATVTVPAAPPPPEPSLALAHKLRGRELTLTAKVPTAVSGRITFTLRAYNHTKRIAHVKRSVRPAHCEPVLRLELSKREAKASKIEVSVSAANSHGATVVFKG